MELYKALMQTENKSQFVYALDFLKKKIVDDRVYDPDFHAVYAKLLWEAGVKDTAAGMATAALLILYTDRARCADESAGFTKITKRFAMFKEMFEYLRELPLDDKIQIIDIALEIEERVDNRPANRNMCYTGIKATTEALKYAEDNKIELEKSGPDSYVIPDFKHVKVEYISDHEWHKKRQDLREQFPTYFMKGR